MTDAQKTVTPRDLYSEQTATHEDVRRLHPLLSLLEEPEGSGALDEIKALLTAMVAILGQHSQALAEIRSNVGHAGANPTA